MQKIYRGLPVLSLLLIILLSTLSFSTDETLSDSSTSQPPFSYYELFKSKTKTAPEHMGFPPPYIHNYDVKHYTIDIEIDFDEESISGTTSIKVTSEEDGLDEITFNLETEFTVSGVEVSGDALTYDHNGGNLIIHLNNSYNVGDIFTIDITYSGQPSTDFYFSNRGCFTLCECEGARHWFPCYDYLDDKSDEGVDLYITVPDGYVACANGTLESEISENGFTEFYWRHTYPIPTYLVCCNAADYTHFSDSYEGLPIEYYVYPEDYDDCLISFEHIPDMIECFEELYTLYPYPTEKYGQVGIGGGGGMENTTLTSINAYYFTPDYDSDWLYAHELAHHWWGDWVTCETWMDIWLNEGFATYSDALWHEWFEGDKAFHKRMSQFRGAIFYYNEDFPIYNPIYMWGTTVYQKGAWILHMMRHYMDNNDMDFFGTVRYYGNNYSYGLATTDEFQTDIEDYTGADWDWFFDQWVYKAKYPEYEWSWELNNPTEVVLNVSQTQDIDDLHPIFDMPVDIRAITSDGFEDTIVRVDDLTEEFTLEFSHPVYDIHFDPDGWILCRQNDLTETELIGFNGIPTSDGVKLNWEIQESLSLEGYNLYRREKSSTTSLEENSSLFDSHSSISLPQSDWTLINDELIMGGNPYSYTDDDVIDGMTYEYLLVSQDYNNEMKNLGSIEVINSLLPQSFEITSLFPNPSDGGFNIRFSVYKSSTIYFEIYDTTGRLVKKYNDHNYNTGTYLEHFNLEETLVSGLYIVNMNADGSGDIERFVVVR